MRPHPHFNALFAPETVAIIGRCEDDCACGSVVLSHLYQSKFAGKVFAVNPDGGNIPGIETVSKISDLPVEKYPLDLAYTCLPAEETPARLEELAKIGTKAVIVTGTGFRESGRLGVRYDEEVAEIARKNQMVVLGPNSIGLMRPSIGLAMTSGNILPSAGNIGFFSQSRSLCADVLDWAQENNLGFSCFASLGNKALTDESDMLAYMADDPETEIIVGYLEDIIDGERFMRQAHKATRKKPVVIMRPGRTSAGACAASAHSGHMPGSDIAYEAAFRQCGVIRVKNFQELFAVARAFSSGSLPKGPGVGIVTNSGAASIIAADAVANSDLYQASLTEVTLEALKKELPRFASVYNPVDVSDLADAGLMGRAARSVLNDPNTHSLLVIATRNDHLDMEALSEELIAMAKTSDKPILFCLMRSSGQADFVKNLRKAGVGYINYPDSAIKALEHLYKYHQWLESPYPVDVQYRRDLGKARLVLDSAYEAHQVVLEEFQAAELLKAYEMPVLDTRLARTSEEAIQIFRQIGEPVVLKLASPHIQYKSAIDGIKMGLDTPDKVRQAFMEITTNAAKTHKSAYIAGCLVQAQAPEVSEELVIGFKRDGRFGAILHFGLTGIHRDTYKDYTCRVAPLSMHDAPAMVREIKAFPRLAGAESNAPVDFTALEDILLILSTLAVDFPEVQEVECDPVLVNEDGATVVGMKVVLNPEIARTNPRTFPSS